MRSMALEEFTRNEERLQMLEEKINPAANKSTQVRGRGFLRYIHSK